MNENDIKKILFDLMNDIEMYNFSSDVYMPKKDVINAIKLIKYLLKENNQLRYKLIENESVE